MPPTLVRKTRPVIAAAASGGDAFVPSDLLGLKLWLKADSIAGAEDTAVALWTDHSANVGHATQTVTGNKPLLKKNILNGLPVVRFDGTDDFMHLPLVLDGTMTVFMVYKFSGAHAGADSLLTVKFSDTSFSELIFTDAANYGNITLKHDFVAAADSVGWDATLDTAGHILAWTYNDGTNTEAGSYTIAQEGTQTVGAFSGDSARAGTDKGSLGARASSTDVGSLGFLGDVAEIIIYNRVLPAARINQVGAYLRRWGLTWLNV